MHEHPTDLAIYSGRTAPTLQPVLDRFRAATGLSVHYWSARHPEVLARVRLERGAPRADLLIHIGFQDLECMRPEGFFDSYDAPALALWPPGFAAHDRTWIGFSGWPRAILYNRNLVLAGECPLSMFDFELPRWNGRTGMAGVVEHYTVGWFATLRAIRGDDFAAGHARALLGNNVRLYPNNRPLRESIGNGEVAAGPMSWPNYFLELPRGTPVAVAVPDQRPGEFGAPVNCHTVSLLRNAPHPQSARTFIDFLLTKETQELLATTTGESPIHPNANPGPAPRIADLRQPRVTQLEVMPLYADTRDFLRGLGFGIGEREWSAKGHGEVR